MPQVIKRCLILISLPILYGCGGFKAEPQQILQNLGHTSHQDTSTQTFVGNGVREAGLVGQDELPPEIQNRHSLRSKAKSLPSASAESPLFDCEPLDGGQRCLAEMPKIEQRSLKLKSVRLAEMACVPTSMLMVLEARFRNREAPMSVSWAHELFSKPNYSERVAWLAEKLNTSEIVGTYFNQIRPLLDILARSFRELDFFGSKEQIPYPRDNPAVLALESLQAQGLLILNYGNYEKEKLSNEPGTGKTKWKFKRTGGHSVAVRGFEKIGNQVKMIYNDPWDGLVYVRDLKMMASSEGQDIYELPHYPAWSLFNSPGFEEVAIFEGFQDVVPLEPEPTLLIEGVSEIKVNPGQWVQYKWDTSQITNVSSTYQVLGEENCWGGRSEGEWVVNSSSKNFRYDRIDSCMSGSTYILTIKGQHPVTGKIRQATAKLIVNKSF